MTDELKSEQGLCEDSSQGSMDMASEIDHRPELPTDGPDLQQPIRLDNDLSFDGEPLFGSSPLFEGLEPEEVREIVRASTKVQFESGDVLFEQGVQAQALYILQNGELQVRAIGDQGEDIVLAMLGPGTVVGELGLIDGGPRSATVEAISSSVVYRLDRKDFESLKAQMRPAAFKVIMNLAKTVDSRRRQAERRIDEVFDDPEQHIDIFESQVHDMLARLRKV